MENTHFEITPQSLKKLCKELKMYAPLPQNHNFMSLEGYNITQLHAFGLFLC